MDANQWKTKYKKAISELESKEKTWGSLETLLRKAIGRLAIAGFGIDAQLDKQLKDIQKLSRNKKDDELGSALDQLSNILNTIDEKPKSQKIEVREELSNMKGMMSSLLDLLVPPEQFKPSIDKLKTQLPQQNSQTILNELAAELNSIMASPIDNPKNDGQIDDVIMSLLDRLSIIPGMAQKAKSIQQQIAAGIQLEQWPSVLDTIAKEVNKALKLINDEKSELELFIAQVTEQLVEITGFLSDDKQSQHDGLADVESFHLKMHEEVSKMHAHIQTSDDIDSLKQILDSNITSLKENIAEYLSKGKHRFQQAEARNIELNKQVIAMEKETQDLKKRLDENKQKLIFDPLTGVRNRLAYDDYMSQLIARWQRYKESFCYTILDIDHFKNVNDTYGHNTGDKVLKLVAKIMQNCIRESDTLFRIGGEEFVLILPNTSTDQASPAIEKLRKSVSNSGFRYKEEPLIINLSAGLTAIKPEDTAESLYERADKGLYQAKETGRNKLIIV